MTKGVSWLNSQVHGDGSLVGEAQSMATPMQARADTALTLKQLSTLPSSIPANIAAIAENNTQYLSRKILVLSAAGTDTSGLISTLTPLRNYDGGFGMAFGYSSGVVDTSWAVLALAQAGQGGSQIAIKARSYLVGQINPGGGTYGSTLAAQLYQSAIALQALQTTPDNSNASAIGNLANWLKMEQGTDGSWTGSTFLTAYALLAIAPVNSDSTINGNAAAYLLAKQGSDGSWSDDPYLTAVVLRALALQPVSTPGQTAIQGQVVNSATNLPLAGATITIVGGSASATSDSNGNFTLSGLTAGSYSVGVAASGYIGVTKNASVASNQTTNLGPIGLAQTSSGAIVSGQIVAAGSGIPLAGVTVSVTGATTATAVTDSSGHYVLTGVAPGAVSITASLTGYQTVSASTTLAAGQTVSFAPGLTASGQTAPTSIVYSGKVVSAGTQAALAGVTVQLSGSATAATTTDANGNFSITLSPGTYSAAFTLSGYTGQTQNIAAAAGATVNGGVVALAPVLTSSTIKGVVQNASNQPIAGATVQIAGGAQTTTAADGSYSIANVSGTSITLNASATGYDTQITNLSVPQPAIVTQNFSLAAQTAGSLTIGNLSVNPTSVGSNTNVTVGATIANSGGDTAAAAVQLQVFDASGKLLGTGNVFDTSGNQIGQVSLAGGQSTAISLVWNSGQFVPGTYSLVARLVQVGSMTKSLPQGVQLAQAAASVAVTGQNHISGSVAGNPPVLQTGTNTAVQFTATVKNDGNQALSAQTYTLSVVNAADSSVATTLQASGAAMPVNAIQTLSFGSWQPTNGANYNLVVQAADPTLGSVTGTLYVGGASTAAYTTDKQLVPTGTQKVRGTVQVLGQNVATGTINDPLAPLIKAAIQKSVTYNDATAAQWTQDHGCYGCHIQSQALVGGETNIALTTYNASQRSLIFDAIVSRQHDNGAIYEDSDSGEYRTASMHGNWALDAYHDQSVVVAKRVLGGQYLASLQNSDGHWDYDRAWMGGWTSAMDHTAMNVKSLIGTLKSLQKNPTTSLPPTIQRTVTPMSQTSTGQMAQDAAGNIYLDYQGSGTVAQIKPDGTTGLVWSGLNQPSGIAMDKAGTGLIVSSAGGIFHLTMDGNMTQVSTYTNINGLTYGPDGMLYGTFWNGGQVLRMDDQGNVTIFANVPWPGYVTFDAAGNMYVPAVNQGSIWRVAKDGTTSVAFGVPATPVQIVPYGKGWLLAATNGLYIIDTYGWLVKKLDSNWASNVVIRANGELVTVSNQGAQMVAIDLVSRSFDPNAVASQFDAAIGTGTQWMLAQSPTDNIALSHQLIGLGEADKYYTSNASLRATIEAKMATIAATLRSNQNSDGGWGAASRYGSDAFVTAHVGYALGYTNPSPTDPVIRNAVTWLLSQQQADGSWYSANGIFSTHVATTTWVSIWLPQALSVIGGIDTDLSVTFPPNVAMSNPDTAPASVAANADGSSTALWHLTGVTAAGQTVNYDLTLQNMLANEVRPVSTDAHLTFNNSFTNGTVNAPITIPQVTASAFLTLGVATDQAGYPANTLVNISGNVANTAGAPSSGTVKFNIVAPDGSTVASLGSMPFNQLAGNSSTSLAMTWNTGNQAAASGYIVIASLYDSAGTLVATAKAPFAISASNSGAGSTTLSQSTDKQTYQASDTVNLTDKLISTSSNTALGPLTITTTVTGGGTSIFSKTESLSQLVAGAQKSYSYAIALHGAAAGSYQGSVIVLDTNGNTVAQAQSAFTVASSAGSGNGLTGTISAGSTQVQIGNPVTLTYSASNAGNSALANLPLTVAIIDPVAQKVIASYPTTQSIAIGTSYAGSDSWTSAGTVGNNYVAVLSATVGGGSVTLAQTTFTLVAPPYKLGNSQNLWSKNRVLVLTACNDDEGEGDDQQNDAAQHLAQHAIPMRKDEDGGDDDKSKACTAARYKAIDSALTTLGITHLMTGDTTSFTVAMRGGLYDTLWIAPKQSGLNDDLSNEIIEIVNAGATLIVDGNTDQRNNGFDRIGGVKSRDDDGGDGDGHHGTANVNFDGSFYSTPQTLPVSGKARVLKAATGAIVEATYTNGGSGGNQAAMITNTYGAGRTVIAGFDIGTTLAAETSQATAWDNVLATTLAAVTPQATASLTPGQYLPVQTVVANQGSAVAVDALTTIPAGALYLGASPSATVNLSANSADWNFNLDVAASQALDLALRAPATGGSYSLQTVVSTVANGSTTPYGDPLTLAITVTAAATHATNANTGLQTLSLTGKADQKLRTTLLANLNQAMNDFNLNSYKGYANAIDELVEIADRLAGFSNANAAAASQIRTEIDAILQEAQWRWTLLRPEIGGKLDIDKSQCKPHDTVTLTANLSNVAAVTLTGLSVTTTITGPITGSNSGSAALFLTKAESLPQFAANATQTYRYPITLNGAAAGTYQVAMTVTDTGGKALAQVNGSFKIGSGG